MEIQILHQTQRYVVCVKPQGVESQHQMPSLLQNQLGCPVWTVHRLDKETGGVMVYAKTAQTAAHLSEQIQQGAMEKTYCTIVSGQPQPDEGVYEDLLFRDGAKNKSYVVKRMRRGVKKASLSYRVLRTWQEKGAPRSLVAVTLHTGRTHQIRVQFSSRQMPVVGDKKYGGGDGPLHLWSSSLQFADEQGLVQVFTHLPQWYKV